MVGLCPTAWAASRPIAGRRGSRNRSTHPQVITVDIRLKHIGKSVVAMNEQHDTSSKMEIRFANAVCRLTGHTWSKQRPSWLVNDATGCLMELDMVCDSLSMAIEYQGAQHNTFPNTIHANREEFDLQVGRDRKKRLLCLANGIRLVEIQARSSLHLELDDFLCQCKAIGVAFTGLSLPMSWQPKAWMVWPQSSQASGCQQTTSVSQTITTITEREVVEALVMECLSRNRADVYGDWIEIGMCLHSMTVGARGANGPLCGPDEGEVGDLFDLWVAFSGQSPKYAGHDGECRAKWTSFGKGNKRGPVTERTLKLRAREDSPTAYHEVLQQSLGGLIAKCAAADSDHGSIAMVVHRMYKDEFVCASIKHRRWYMFDAHRWRPIEEAFVLRRRISREVASLFIKAATKTQSRAGEEGCDSDQRAALIKTSQRLVGVAGKLDNMRHKDMVLRECADIFYVPDFASKLDADDSLLCFENGVYDLDAGVFRAGRPDDNLSLSVGYDYAGDVLPKYRDELLSFVGSTQSSPEMTGYVLKVLAYMLHGFKFMENLWFWTGKSGRNGKSTIASLLKVTFGEFYYEPNAAIFTTSERNPSAACPEIANMKGKRCIVASEPPDAEGQTFKVNKLKNWRGNEAMKPRRSDGSRPRRCRRRTPKAAYEAAKRHNDTRIILEHNRLIDFVASVEKTTVRSVRSRSLFVLTNQELSK